MIFLVCVSCRLGLRVLGESCETDFLVGKQSGFWPDRYPCPRCEQNISAQEETSLAPSEVAQLELRDVGPQELFSALNGLGLPEEHECSFATVARLLQRYKIKTVIGEDVPGSGRSVIHSIELENGAKLHLGASPEGAVVFRNTPPQRYVDKVSHG
jgi:hypothetical protein